MLNPWVSALVIGVLSLANSVFLSNSALADVTNAALNSTVASPNSTYKHTYCRTQYSHKMLNDGWVVNFANQITGPGATIETLFLRDKVALEFNSLIADFRVLRSQGEVVVFLDPYFISTDKSVKHYKHIALVVDKATIIEQPVASGTLLALGSAQLEKIKAGGTLSILLDNQLAIRFRLKGSRKALNTAITLFAKWSSQCP